MPEKSYTRMEKIEICAVLYPEGDYWIAQGLEYDITAQALSLDDLHETFAARVAMEVAVSLDLGEEPLRGIQAAPEKFWHMYKEARMTVSAELPPLRISDGVEIPPIIPKMKIGRTDKSQ